MINDLSEFFQERFAEIDSYLDFLTNLENAVQGTYNPRSTEDSLL
jgi:hypothetical protein